MKLYGTMMTSSIWLESPSTRVLFLSMLMDADRHGYVAGSVGGMAHRANIGRDECRVGLEILESPDPDSRTPDNDGRRIEKCAGGWRVLNYAKYREMRTEKQVDDAERQALHRAKNTGRVTNSDERDVSRDNRQMQIADSRSQRTAVAVHDTPAVVSLCNALPIQATDAVQELAERSGRPKGWATAIQAMLSGLGAPRGIPVAADALAQALIELAATDYRCTPAVVRAFLTRAQVEPTGTAPADGVTTRMRDLIAQEDRKHAEADHGAPTDR